MRERIIKEVGSKTTPHRCLLTALPPKYSYNFCLDIRIFIDSLARICAI